MDMKEHDIADEQSSMLYWWPKIKDLDIPQPKTKFVNVNTDEILEILNRKQDTIPQEKEIRELANSFGYPVFVRSDHLSDKHSWKDTCYVPDSDNLMPHIYRIAEDSLMMSMMGELGPNAIFVREFIPLKMAGFTAFEDFPVSKEVRCFVRDGVLECVHPYWFDDAVAEVNDTVKKIGTGEPVSPEHWKKMLAEMNILTDHDTAEIKRYANIVSKKFDDYWSVDFAKGSENGHDWHYDQHDYSSPDEGDMDRCSHCEGERWLAYKHDRTEYSDPDGHVIHNHSV